MGGPFSFSIPPDEIKTFHGTKTLEEDISLISLYPHCHYLGRDWEIYAITPAGDTINIIRIADWDFNWQGSYTFDRMKKIPEGSVMHIYATYDNTEDNPFNPNYPPQTVTWGEGTKDEMYLVGLIYVPYQEGDEYILMGEEMTTDVDDQIQTSAGKLYAPFPNPSSALVSLNFYLPTSQEVSIDLYDVDGQQVKTMVARSRHAAGNHRVEFNVADLPAGIYMIRLSGTDTQLVRPLVVTK